MTADLRTVMPDPEMALLAACLTQGSAAYYQASEHMTVDDLSRPSHKAIWRAIGRVADSGARPDVHVVWGELGEDRSFLEDAGGASCLVAIAAVEAVRGNAAIYGQQVRDHAAKSRLRHLLTDAVAKLDKDALDIEQFQETVFRVSERPDDRAVSFVDAIEGLAKEFKRPDADMLTFPWFEVQAWTRGMRPGQLVLLAGETSHGKSAAALAISSHLMQAGHSVLYLSMEMEPRELALRLAQMQGYDSDRHYARASDIDMRPLTDVGAMLLAAERESYIRHVERVTQIPALIRRHRPDLVVVDHIGLLNAEGRSPYERVSNSSRALKLLARRYELPTLCLCQLSRNHQGTVPMTLDRLRDSGRIGEDADTVLFVWRKRDEQGVLTSEGKFVVAKSRNGRQGSVSFNFDGRRQVFDVVSSWK